MFVRLWVRVGIHNGATYEVDEYTFYLLWLIEGRDTRLRVPVVATEAGEVSVWAGFNVRFRSSGRICKSCQVFAVQP